MCLLFVLISGEGEQRRTVSFPLIIIFFITDFSYFLLISIKKKKNQNSVVSAPLTATVNWSLKEYYIYKNWKLENWNDKIES